MFKSYFRIAWKNIERNKAFAFINITGLAIGIAASLLLFIVVEYELSYDTFQKNYSNIYRIVSQDKYSDGISYTEGVPVPVIKALRAKYPSIVFTALNSTNGSQVTVPVNNGTDKKFIEESGVFFCEPQFFNIFNAHWLGGNASTLDQPNVVVLSKAMAEKYFGNWQDAMGKTIKLDNALTLKINGVIDNAPGNSDFPMNVLASYETMKQSTLYNYNDDWGSTSSSFQVYALLPQNMHTETMNANLDKFSKEHYADRKSSVKTNFLQPLKDIHFDKRFGNLGNHSTSKTTLWTLSLIGIFILLMACINFINLSTAQAVNRSKEVGIRKVLGSNRMQLFWQIMGETALIVLLAVAVALCIAWILLPYIKHIASIEEQLSLFNITTIALIAAITFAVTFLAGIYPSIIMSGFNPLKALKNKMTTANAGGISLRRSLVVAQFAISQVLIVGTIVAVSQMNFIRNADLGFNKDAVLVLNGSSDSVSVTRLDAFKAKLLSMPGIQSVSMNTDVPSSDNNWSTSFAYNHLPTENYQIHLKFGDTDYIRTFGLQLVAGHNYEASDTARQLLVNETLAKKLSPANPKDVLGKVLEFGGDWLPIAGIVKDFKDHSLRSEVKPIIISSLKKYYGVIAVKINSGNLGATKDAIEKVWNEYYPDYAYSAKFLDEKIASFYEQEEQLSLLYKIFAGLAIFISCLGLYGLVSFMTVQKTKEVGIRKVLGASVASIVYMFSKEFTILIIISFVIATPIAWYIMNNWLSSFVYRIPLGIGFFAGALLLSVIISWLSVGYKAVRAAIVNPVTSLRSE